MAILSHEFAGEERAAAFFWGASLGIALAADPIVGGAITNFPGSYVRSVKTRTS
jgi:hypothetical protein